jgi:hypothetical protein
VRTASIAEERKICMSTSTKEVTQHFQEKVYVAEKIPTEKAYWSDVGRKDEEGRARGKRQLLCIYRYLACEAFRSDHIFCEQTYLRNQNTLGTSEMPFEERAFDRS